MSVCHQLINGETVYVDSRRVIYAVGNTTRWVKEYRSSDELSELIESTGVELTDDFNECLNGKHFRDISCNG